MQVDLHNDRITAAVMVIVTFFCSTILCITTNTEKQKSGLANLQWRK